MRNLIIILLLSFFGHSHAQKDASDYFNAAALLYVNKYDDACKNKIKEGLQKFPTDYRLLALGKKVGYEPESNDCDRDDDRDGIKNCEDECPTDEGTMANNGCPPENPPPYCDRDDDRDGIKNCKDKCPNVFGTTANNGCPPENPPPTHCDRDYDGDGIKNCKDKCPNVFGTTDNNGCPKYTPPPTQCDKDDDKDGIKNCKDKCPNVFGTTANNGCPIVLEGEGEEVIIDLNFLRGDGNKVSWSKDIANKAKSITITFIDEDGKKWVDKENVTGNSYIYNPGDGRAGDKSTQVILSIIMEKGVKVKGPLTLNNQYFKCRSEN